MGFLDKILGRKDSPHEEPPSSIGPLGMPGDWQLVPELSDDFSGSALDTTKWEPFNKTWKGRAPGWFNPSNVTVSGGSLNLSSRVEEAPAGYPEKFNTFSTSFVRSKARIKYGLIEAVVQTADSVTSSSFWLVHNQREDWNEIDVFESSQAAGHERKFHMNMHVFRKDGAKLAQTYSKPKWVQLERRMCEKALVVAVAWDEEYVTWLVEGKVVRREKNEAWNHEMWVQFDCETMGGWFGLPEVGDGRLPAVFRVFGVRTWKKA